MYNLSKFAEEMDMTVEELLVNENDELDAFYDAHAHDVAFGYEDTINYLIKMNSDKEFYKEFDDALVRISNNTKNDYFSIETAEGTKKSLFGPITDVVESKYKNNFTKAIFSIIAQEKFDFGGAFENKFDFYSTIFEYLIKDYNVASGVYAEYFTPQSVSSIIAKILVSMSENIGESEIYDPSAGSGSLILHLAHELGQDKGINKALVYSQDISSKSTRFLRINLLLNGVTESLSNVIQGDTLLNPAHYKIEHEPTSGLKKFDYITSNPPFKMDFSSTRNRIEQKWEETNRYFAGVPTIPNKKKESMAIYLLFIQHILYSLKEDGKAAIVVPSGFLTAQSGIEKKLRIHMIDTGMLRGVVTMPSNIFANTGTNVSVLFLDKSHNDKRVSLVDASKMGTKQKDGKNQRTILSNDEVEKIIETFTNSIELEDFSAIVSNQDIKDKDYSFGAGQYFKVKIDYVNITEKGFNDKMEESVSKLQKSFNKRVELEKKVISLLEGIKYE